MMKKTIKEVEVKGKKVFIRCDFNVPLDENQQITNELRIVNALPTIKEVLRGGGKAILASHLGRPKGEKNPKYSLKPVAERLSVLLNQPVPLLDDCIGDKVEQFCNDMKDGEAVLLENVRFHKAETSKDKDELGEFGEKLSRLADIFVGDAFGSAHRAHASVVYLAQKMPAYCGYLMANELEYFDKVLNSDAKPVVAILGGAKVSDKILLINNLLNKVDKIFIGGGMAYTFLHALGQNIGDSLLERDRVDTAKEILNNAKEKNIKIILPSDNIICDKFSNDANTKIAENNIPSGWQGIDVGPKTLKVYQDELQDAKVIVWNGPVGVFEIEKFAKGTKELGQFIADSPATTIIGGGDTAAAIYKFGLESKMSHISTGGGASLELLEGKELPGVTCLQDL